jgi:phosphatidylserine/phosphatidylglycerophosphate/cardiolipin synthase-like enzyme
MTKINFSDTNSTSDWACMEEFSIPKIKHFGFGELSEHDDLSNLAKVGIHRFDENKIEPNKNPLSSNRKIRISKPLKSKLDYFINSVVKISKVALEIIIKFNPVTPNTQELDLEIRSQQQTDVKNIRVGQWTKGNSAFVTQSSQETIEWKLEFVKSANHSIEISGSICGGEVFRETLFAIEDRIKQRPNLQVYLLTTPDLLEKADRDLLKILAEKYPGNFHYLIGGTKFNKDLYRVENHVKLMVIDEQYYITGGTNYQSTLSRPPGFKPEKETIVHKMMGSSSSDMDLIGKGSQMASVMRREFFKLYAILEYKSRPQLEFKLQNHYQPLPATIETKIIKFEQASNCKHDLEIKAITGCSDRQINNYTQAYADLIKSSDEITLAHMFFHPPIEIEEAFDLNQKAKVTIISTNIHKSSPKFYHFFAYANVNFYKKLLKRKNDKQENLTQVFTYNNGSTLYHKKVGVFKKNKKGQDHYYTLIGSYNCGGKSRLDYEFGVIVRSKAIAEQTLLVLEEDKRVSEELKDPNSNLAMKILAKVEGIAYPFFIG